MTGTAYFRFTAPAAVLTAAAVLGAFGQTAPAQAFWLLVPALVLAAVGAALAVARLVRPGYGFTAGCATAALVLAVLAWLLPEHRDWAWGIAALAALFAVRSVLPCASCLGGTCRTKPTGLEGFRFPPGH